MWKALRKGGAAIVSTWIDEAGTGDTTDFTELWSRIESEIRMADRLVLYVEPGDFPLKGALVEVGMALARGKQVMVVAPGVVIDPRDFKPLGSWVGHPNVSLCDSLALAFGPAAPEAQLFFREKPAMASEVLGPEWFPSSTQHG